MAEEVVSLAIKTLASLIENEVELLGNFNKELHNIKGELESIRALLKDADAQSEMTETEQVKVWLKDLRHVAFDVEDLLEEYVLRYQAQQQEEADVRGLGICGFVHSIIHFFNQLKMQHDMANRIKEIKLQIENISERKNKFAFVDLNKVSTTASTSYRVRDPREDALFLDEAKVVGITEPRDQLIEWLVEDKDASLGVVSVFGQGGLGKTTLVNKVYESGTVKNRFKIHGWITVSQSYDSNRLMIELILAACKEEKEKKDLLSQLQGLEARQLKEKLQRSYEGQRYVVVMDDIWDLGAWSEIKSALPDGGCGSRIIVTTRNQDIANYCQENSGYAYKLKPLSPEDSWSLFHKVAHKSNVLKNSYSGDDHLREVIQKFLKKCGGVPLAIVAIAGLLSTKETIDLWDKISAESDSLLSHFQLGDVNIILSLSYSDLPYHLKSCLLYLCMYPEDHIIDCPSLLRLWAAEGFCDSDVATDTKEDKAESYLDELIARSLIQVEEVDGLFRFGKVSKCRIHDLLRDFLLGKARDQEFAECLLDNKPNSGRLRRASFSNAEDVTENTTLSTSLPQIRSLLIFGHTTSSIISRFVCGSRLNKLLKVLHLEDARLAEFPSDDVTTNLFFLRYLRLGFNNESATVCIPTSLGKLVNLETLDLSNFRHDLPVELPDEILKLTRLRNLLGHENGGGLRLPKGIGRLSSLENLDRVNGSEGIDGTELGKLTRLRTLFIKDLRGEDATAVLALAIEKMKYLRYLGLVMADENSSCGFEVENMMKQPPPPPQLFQLQMLYLSGRMKGTPDWILSFYRLSVMYLAGSQIKGESFFEGLQLKLPNLVRLCLKRDAIKVEHLCFHRGSFPKLRYLTLDGSTKLRFIRIEEGAMPCILTIQFFSCEELEYEPTGIGHLTTLKTILFFGMSEHFDRAIRTYRWKAGHYPDVIPL